MSKQPNAYRRGIVTEVDPVRARAKVQWRDKQGSESPWLEVGQQNTLRNKGYWLPDAGELVACLLDDTEEAGLILCALYTQANLPPNPSQDVRRVTFEGGAVVEFDRAANALQVTGAANVNINVSGQVTVVAPNVKVEGALEVTETAKVAGGSSAAAMATQVQADFQTIASAIAGATTVPQDGGAAFKAAVSTAIAAIGGAGIASQKLTID